MSAVSDTQQFDTLVAARVFPAGAYYFSEDI